MNLTAMATTQGGSVVLGSDGLKARSRCARGLLECRLLLLLFFLLHATYFPKQSALAQTPHRPVFVGQASAVRQNGATRDRRESHGRVR